MTNKDKVAQWIKYWGNGGGCLSLQNYIQDVALGEDNEDQPITDSMSLDEIRKILLDFDPDFGEHCNRQYKSLIKEMINNLKEEEEKPCLNLNSQNEE